ncbi:MAG: MopE-related protein [Myxococcota bacterium]
MIWVPVSSWLRPLVLTLPLALAMACAGDDGSDPTDSDTDTDVALVDADGDGFTDDVDCDDNNPDINPEATEDDCEDPIDYNCDGETPLYADADGDGFAECVDCRDTNPDINPDAAEICDGLDNDCDEAVDAADDSITDAQTYYRDGDSDGFGNATDTIDACRAPTGYTDDNTDCDDTLMTVNPEADEVCDTVDNDCDDKVDDEDDDIVDQSTWFADVDEDSLGDANTMLLACFAPDGYIDNDLDCDDADAESGEATPWFSDSDGDGYGAKASRLVECEQPKGYVIDDTDCDDTDTAVNPAATEVCDRIDNDCDSDVDDDDSFVSGTTDWFPDTDEDEYGDEDATPTAACVAPKGYTADDTDCDDSKAVVHPGRFDFDDDIDNDCDGSTDEDVGSETYTHDSDIQSIWNSKCTGCHGSSGGLSLTSAHSKIVGSSSTLSGMDQIEPGDLDNSYLWLKLEGTHSAAGGSGAKMPRSGSMTTAELDKIETWILEGAVK